MPDGSHAALHTPPRARQPSPLDAPAPTAPSLTDALERLLACAGQGLRPDGVLRDIRALLRERGLLSSPAPERSAGPTRRRPDAPPTAEVPAADAIAEGDPSRSDPSRRAKRRRAFRGE